MDSSNLHKYGWLGALIAASSPVPDDPIIIPLALTNYDLPKLTAGYFIEKVAITLLGAHMGEYFTIAISDMLGSSWVFIASVILTISITIPLIKRRKEIGRRSK